MNQEDKELLIKEVSNRLPYGINASVLGWDDEKGEVEVSLKVYSINTDGYVSFEYNHYDVQSIYIEDCRLYLRPMTSMTEEEKEELSHLLPKDWSVEIDKLNNFYFDMCSSIFMEIDIFFTIIDWLNAHHFDYRGLIEKGFAIEVEK